jgi:hypothetical protein
MSIANKHPTLPLCHHVHKVPQSHIHVEMLNVPAFFFLTVVVVVMVAAAAVVMVIMAGVATISAVDDDAGGGDQERLKPKERGQIMKVAVAAVLVMVGG